LNASRRTAAPGTAVVTDKGLSGPGTEEFFAGDSLGLTLIRPARKDEKQQRPFPNWLSGLRARTPRPLPGDPDGCGSEPPRAGPLPQPPRAPPSGP